MKSDHSEQTFPMLGSKFYRIFEHHQSFLRMKVYLFKIRWRCSCYMCKTICKVLVSEKKIAVSFKIWKMDTKLFNINEKFPKQYSCASQNSDADVLIFRPALMAHLFIKTLRITELTLIQLWILQYIACCNIKTHLLEELNIAIKFHVKLYVL